MRVSVHLLPEDSDWLGVVFVNERFAHNSKGFRRAWSVDEKI